MRGLCLGPGTEHARYGHQLHFGEARSIGRISVLRVTWTIVMLGCDLLAFGRKDTDVLRFENADIAGELLSLTDESECEQLMITD